MRSLLTAPVVNSVTTAVEDRSNVISREVLLYLLEHLDQQVRFEAPVQTTEFGVLKGLRGRDSELVKHALRDLEMGRLVNRRTQYVAGYSEPKHVFALTPTGHQAALASQKDGELRLEAVNKRPGRPVSDDDFPDDDDYPAPDYGNDDNPAEDWHSDKD